LRHAREAPNVIDVYRFILAVCVVQGHLLASGAPWLAWQAVFSFYVLSGFLMGLVLNKDYGFTAGGFARFFVNRWLRLFPTYYVVIGLTALYIACVGPLAQINAALALPTTARAIIANIVIVTLPGFDSSQMVYERLSPTAWSLGIELCCYFLLAAYFAKSTPRLLFMLVVGIGLAAAQIVAAFDQPDYGFLDHYSVLQAGIIPFALGGLAYFSREMRFYTFSSSKLLLLAALFVGNALIGHWSDFHRYVSGLYVAAALNVLLVPMLFRRVAKSEWQIVLGGLSYPLFLSHWFIGTLILVYLPAVSRGSFAHFTIATLASVLFCLLLYYSVDQPVQKLRTVIKRYGALPQPAAAL
jgi:peptidoglycan/LPS O-acetylase OafA/YrhL